MSKPYSYFLPRGLLTTSSTVDDVVEQEAVFTYTFNDADTNDFHSVCECKEPLCVTNNGNTVMFAMRKWDKTILYKSYQHLGDTLVLSNMRTLLLDKDYEHRLYDYKEEVCFLFRSELVVARGEGFTNIHISCMVSNDSSWTLLEDIGTFEFGHFFNKYHVFMCAEKKRIVVVTGHYKYGFKKSHNELCDTHMQILSYQVHKHATPQVQIEENCRHNVTQICQQHRSHFGKYIDRVFFSQDATKLFLLSSKEYFVIVFSIEYSRFGQLYAWDGSLRDDDWYTYLYAYHKDVGHVLYVCEMNGRVSVLNEHNLDIRPLQHRDFAMCDLGYPFERFHYFVVDYFSMNLLYVVTTDTKVVLIVDTGRKMVVGKYTPEEGCCVLDVTTNWSGEEVFLFESTPSNGFNLNVLYVEKRRTLKDIAKLQVLQKYSVHELKGMNLPRMLKQEINEWFNQ